MYLTREQERMMEGEKGVAVRKSMELLVALGEVFEAERLIPVESAHISGVSYKNLGDAGTEWLEEHASMGARCKVRATLNPAGMDMEKWREMNVTPEFAEGQRRVIDAFTSMGVEPTCTCTPYLIGHVPRRGTQVAWAESNAVCFSNSVIGSRTNRESGPTTLASAVTGLTALYGYRLDENRKPGKIVKIETDLETRMDYSAVGYITGKLLGRTVPYYKSMGKPDLESMKTLGAACATSGGIALWHGEGVTPEAEEAARHLDGLETVAIERKDIEEARESLVCDPDNPTYCIGCPHCSLREMAETAELVKGKDMDGRLWVFTSRGVYQKAVRAGHVKVIEAARGRVYRDTCMVVAPLHEMGWEGVATNSFKGCHYSVAHGFDTKLATLPDLVEGAAK
ncbi:MAG: aconitase X catalytic domain-containing protein [Candidatus Bathyarchaeota archaeon]|nr:aconitase X catalytic domain-containing protein [Candidatus Bathyarchaeota archaeon]